MTRFLIALATLFAATLAAQDRDRDRDRDRGRWDHAREVTTRTAEDLRHVEHRDAFAHDERERYDHAMNALAEVDRSLAAGKFDKGKLDEAIEQVNHVTQSRALDPRERDRLLDDLRDLRRVREDWR